jgi:hypothetical protein
MDVSVINPIGSAIERTGRILFQPFDLVKWLTLGFCAFLAYLGEGGGGSFNFPHKWGESTGGKGQGPDSVSEAASMALEWLRDHIELVLWIGLALFIVIFLITALVIWVRCRGKFMFIDGLVCNRGAVIEPWKAHRDLGNSLFAFSIALWFIAMVSGFATLAGGLYLAWPDIQADRFGAGAVGAIAVTIAMFALIAITLSIIGALLENFVVPAMYIGNEPVMAAWSTVREEIFTDHVGSVILFLLMKIFIGVVIGTIAFFASCATCFLAAVPYVGTVILLPLIVFQRCYALCFIEQFGPSWRFFIDESELIADP